MPEINLFLGAFRAQSELASGLSTAGMAAILYSWMRIYGVIKTEDMQNFRQPIWLAVAATLFIISIVAAYLISATITGYYFELADGVHQQTHEKIVDPIKHFRKEYAPMMQPMGAIQLLASVLGIIGVSVWYMANVFATSKRIRGGRQ